MNGAEKPIKRLIIDSNTGQFLKEGGGWTFDESEALNFKDILSVLKSCFEHRADHAEVLLRFRSEPAFDVRIPFPNS
jgi:hypothetical protein